MKEIFKQKTKVNILMFSKYLIIFLLLMISSLANIKSCVYPFAFGLYFAFLWCEQDMFVLSAFYLITNYLTYFSLYNLLGALFTVYIAIMVFLLHKKFKKPIKVWLLCIYACVSKLLSFYFVLNSASQIIYNIIGVFLGILFMLACIKIFKYILVRGVALKLTIDELVSIGFILIVLSLGLSNITILHINVLATVSIFLILLSTYIYPNGYGVVVGVLMGLGNAINNGNFNFIALFALFGIVSVMFKNKIKYFSILAVLLCEIVFGLYFKIYGEYSIFNVISVVIGEVLFLIINDNILSTMQIMLGGLTSQTAIRNVVNRSRDGLCKRMYEISQVFFDMNNVFRGLIRGLLPAQEAKDMLTMEIQQNVCKDCPERHKCWRVLNTETNQVFSDILDAGFERGKVLILDIPPFLNSRCNRTTMLLSVINQLLVSYKQYTTMVSNMDASRVLIAEQLEGVSKLLRVLADETKQNVSFDVSKENAIIEELNFKNIVCSEAILYEQNASVINVTLLVRTKDINKEEIEKVCSKLCFSKMMITEISNSTTEGFSVLELKTAPKYDIIFGCSGCNKNGDNVSGDTYTFLRIASDKVLLAVCDGMGSGNSAKITSDTAISLIENFYKAGFDNDIALSSINKLLSLNADDKFSAIDLCVIDLNQSSADFVKLGSPDCFVKHKDEVETLRCNALPLGILEEVNPTIIKKVVDFNDMIILCSDGVVDSFESSEAFCLFLNTISSNNPQIISDAILQKVLSNYEGNPKDDCTVICARVFVRV